MDDLNMRIDEIQAFFKSAFGADSAEIMPPGFAEKVRIQGVVKLHDSARRGTFYVALVLPES